MQLIYLNFVKFFNVKRCPFATRLISFFNDLQIFSFGILEFPSINYSSILGECAEIHPQYESSILNIIFFILCTSYSIFFFGILLRKSNPISFLLSFSLLFDILVFFFSYPAVGRVSETPLFRLVTLSIDEVRVH